MLTAHRATPFETFANIVQFYPRLTASVAFGVMAAFGRMLPSSGRVNEAPAAPPRSSQTMASPAIERPKRTIARRPSAKRARTSRTKRRKAA
jgi:hypothetical protein